MFANHVCNGQYYIFIMLTAVLRMHSNKLHWQMDVHSIPEFSDKKNQLILSTYIRRCGPMTPWRISQPSIELRGTHYVSCLSSCQLGISLVRGDMRSAPFHQGVGTQAYRANMNYKAFSVHSLTRFHRVFLNAADVCVAHIKPILQASSY